MELTRAQYERIVPLLPVQHGNVKLANLQVLNALLYMAEQGCKWRALPERYGLWHTVYMRLNLDPSRACWSGSGRRWSWTGSWLPLALGSTIIKLHPDGEGAPKEGRRRRSGARAAAGRPSCTCSRGTTAAR